MSLRNVINKVVKSTYGYVLFAIFLGTLLGMFLVHISDNHKTSVLLYSPKCSDCQNLKDSVGTSRRFNDIQVDKIVDTSDKKAFDSFLKKFDKQDQEALLQSEIPNVIIIKDEKHHMKIDNIIELKSKGGVYDE